VGPGRCPDATDFQIQIICGCCWACGLVGNASSRCPQIHRLARAEDCVASGREHIASTIREENEQKMKSLVTSLRNRLAYPVIDPGLIKIQDWTAAEIGDFYLKVIEHFAKEIWFMSGNIVVVQRRNFSSPSQIRYPVWIHHFR